MFFGIGTVVAWRIVTSNISEGNYNPIDILIRYKIKYYLDKYIKHKNIFIIIRDKNNINEKYGW